MAEDWAIDVKKYVPDADDAVIAGIVRYCGVALTKRDSSLVSFSDPKETARVRNNFCRKKLGLTDSDSDIDAAIMRTGERMKGDTTRNRVTVYYLLAESFGKLGLFVGKAKATAKGGAASSSAATGKGATTAGIAAAMTAAAPVAAAPVVAAPAAAAAASAPMTAAPTSATAPMTAMASPEPDRGGPAGAAMAQDSGSFLGFGAAVFAGLVPLVFGTMLLGQYIGSRGDAPPVPAAPAPAVAAPPPAVVAAPVIPDGAGVIGETVAGTPKVSVYFDTGSTAVTPDFAAAAAPVKAWLDANPAARLAVSGFNDPTGNAAANAELSKNRAQEVAAALAAIGVPADRIDLVKPDETTAADADMAQARRVEIVVTDAAAE
jgi:outer membrane protein OmpA-like peptidoglycan-associated protein